MPDKSLRIAVVHGMCGGVFAALATLDKALQACAAPPLYVLHELVHNRTVTSELEAKGVRFVGSPEEIPAGAAMVIGAHGVSAAVEAELRKRAGSVTDATCPLVKKLQKFAASLVPEEQLIIFGKKGHPEVIGVAGHSGAGKNFIVGSHAEIDALPELSRPCFLSQTTVDAQEADEAESRLRARFPQIRCARGVCDASRQRQKAVRALAQECDLVLIVGSAHSSNACRLREVAAEAGCEAFRIDGPEELPLAALEKAHRIGLSSGASTPETLFDAVIAKFREKYEI